MSRKVIVVVVLVIVTVLNIILFKNSYNVKLKNNKNEINMENVSNFS